MNDDTRSIARAVGLMTFLTVGSYVLLKMLPTWEVLAAGARERARQEMRAARAWHKARSEVLFEAYTITREAAQ